ncbi:MAG TPA: hypothetical protein VGM27_17150 [Acidobacteriaceae bacterium]
MLIDPVTAHKGLSEKEKAAIQEQLERLLSNSHFSHSRRFPSFLRFVIDQTLAGQTDLLKERTLGIEIFGRDADYDTASDPIVRVTAAEIRKRIAQYYQEQGHEGELRVSLPAGSYVPQFHWPQTATISKEKSELQAVGIAEVPPTSFEPPAPASDNTSHGEQAQAAKSHFLSRPWPRGWLIALPLLLACAGALFLWRSTHHSAFDFFWDPILKTSDPVLFCVADQSQYTAQALRDAGDPSHLTVLKDTLTAIVYDDLNPVVRIAGILQSHGKKYALRSEGTTNLTDLRNGPTVFIGAFDNAWTLRLTKPLRYHFANNPEMTEFRIVDNAAPAQSRWLVNRLQQMTTNNYRDFAIVARFTDDTTGKLAVVAAGVGRGGTIVAGEFLTDPAHLVPLQEAAMLAGNKKNMEVVLSTQIIDGEPGTPTIEATYFW